MKKLSIGILILMLVLSSVVVFADNPYADFTYSGSTITGYTGSETDLEIPSEINGQKITSIAANAFQNKNIQNLLICDGITVINAGAFAGSSVEYCILPETLTSIGYGAFQNCTKLESVIFLSNCELGVNSFNGTPDGISFFLPDNANESQWKTRLTLAKGNSNFYINDDGGSDTTTKATMPFKDVAKDAWYHDAVLSAYTLGIINGLNSTTFAPEKNMTRAEAIKIAAMVYSVQVDSTRETAEALLKLSRESNIWYEPYVAYGISTGIIPIDSEMILDTFDWNKNATRAEMACLFANSDTRTEVINNVSYSFIPDVNENTKYGAEILALYQRGIAQGSDNYKYYPNANVKRNEVATFITRLIGFCDNTDMIVDYDTRVKF